MHAYRAKIKVDFLENKASNEKLLFYIFDFFFRVEPPITNHPVYWNKWKNTVRTYVLRTLVSQLWMIKENIQSFRLVSVLH